MNYFYALLLAIFTVIIYHRRKNLLETAFMAVNTIFFLVVPALMLFLNLEPQEAYVHRGFDTLSFAHTSIRLCVIFSLSFYTAVWVSKFSFRNSGGETLNICKLEKINFHRIYSLGIILGLCMRFIGGDIVHSSIYTLPWQFPLVYGIADHFYQVGVCCLVIDIYINSFNKKNIKYILIVLFLSIFSGSRIALLIPIGLMVILIVANTNKFRDFLLYSLITVFIIFFIILFIGVFRTDELYSDMNLRHIFHLVEFRIADFVWPMALIEKLEENLVNYNPIWALSGLWGAFPAILSLPITEFSIYGRDTAFMLEMGLGLENMSVPLTLIGEGYYWGSFYGVILIGFLSGISIKFTESVIKRLGPLTSAITFSQMFRYVYVLPLAAFPELIASATKDLAISILIALFLIWVSQIKLKINDV